MAARGSSNEPGTQWTSTRSGRPPPWLRAATAPSASFFEMASLKRAATTAKRPAGTARGREGVRGARPAMSVRERREEVAHLVALGQEVSPVVLRGRDLDGHALDDLETIAFDADDLLRIVGEDPQTLGAEIDEDVRPDAVVAQVGLETQDGVCLHRVLALVLQLVGAKLVQEPDAAPLLAHVQEDSTALALDDGERLVELGTAIAAAAAEDVSGEAFGVHADEDGLLAPHIAHDQSQGQPVVHRGLVGDAGELPVLGGQLRGGGAPDQLLLVDAVLDEVLDRDALEPVPPAQGEEVGHPRHASLVVEDLADDAGRVATGQPRQVDGGFRVAGPSQDAPRHRAQGKDVPRPGQAIGAGGRAHQGADGHRPVIGGDAGRHPAPGVHADREGGAEGGGVVAHHHGDLQLVETLGEHGHAHEAAPVHDHEVDGLGGDPVGGHEEVALVLAILVVHDHDDLPRANVLYRGLDTRELSSGLRGHRGSPLTLSTRSTYFPITSISRLTLRPGLRAPRVVRSSVCGISMISKAPASRAATVRLTPSTATEPWGMSRGANSWPCHSILSRAGYP